MAKTIEPIPEEFAPLEKSQEFWETHDTADYDLKKAEDLKSGLESYEILAGKI